MRSLVGTSWKMNLTSTEADQWFAELGDLSDVATACEVFVLPPFPSIWLARERLAGKGVAWGAQDVHPADSGAHTGDVSAPMLADLGCTFVEVGHSERRRDHGETPRLIGSKVVAVVRQGMRPIVCTGEPSPGSSSSALAVVTADLEVILDRLTPDDLERTVIAYEPHWAIGTGAQAASAEHIGAVCTGVHRWLAARAGGERTPVIYGGSVNTDSAASILAATGVDGLFVGRYALDPARFAAIVRIAAERAEASRGNVVGGAT